MNFNEEKMDNVKKVGTNIFHKIKELKNKMTNLEDSGGKIILISKWCLNISFYLMLVLFVVWMFVGIRFSMVYHWGGYYSNGYYSFSLFRYVSGFLAILAFYVIEYLICLWMKSYGELVNNTKLMVDAYQDKEINEDKIEEIDVQNEEDNTLEESNENLIEFEEETF